MKVNTFLNIKYKLNIKLLCLASTIRSQNSIFLCLITNIPNELSSGIYLKYMGMIFITPSTKFVKFIAHVFGGLGIHKYALNLEIVCILRKIITL